MVCYYLVYLEELKIGWETRITRSKDLFNWQDAPAVRYFISLDINEDISEENNLSLSYPVKAKELGDKLIQNYYLPMQLHSLFRILEIME